MSGSSWWAGSGRGRLTLTIVLATIIYSVTAVPRLDAAPPVIILPQGQAVRATWTSELGMAHPVGLAYIATLDELLVVAPDSKGVFGLRIDRDQHLLGSLELPELASPSSISYDADTDTVVGFDDGELMRSRPQRSTGAVPCRPSAPE